MRKIANTIPFWTAKPVLTLFAIAASACIANGQPTGFTEEFAGPGLDSAWNQNGDPNGHPTTIADTYDITDAHGQPGTSLNRSTGGTVSSFNHEIDVVLDPHLLTGSGGTRSDFKLRSIGADGILDVVYNSFGHLRVNHTDFNTGSSDHIAGGSPNNISIGYTDGDALKLRVVYDDGTDTIDVTYSVNGESPVSVYSGTGIDGQFGDVITNSVEVLVFKFGNSLPTQTVAAIDKWSLGTIPDYNGNGFVDAADYTVWRNSLGQTVVAGTDADGSGDGIIDQLDYDVWKLHFGTPVPAAASVAEPVPEPGTCALAIAGLSWIGCCIRGGRASLRSCNL